MRTAKTRSNQKLVGQRTPSFGFSLIEALVVVAIILVMAAVAIPQVKTMLDSYRMSAAARQLAYELRLARFRAVSDFTLAHLKCNTTATPATCTIESCANKSTTTGLCTTSGWSADSTGNQPFSTNVAFGFGSISSSPAVNGANVQVSPTQTNPVTFNSRGLAVDVSGTSQTMKSDNALYIYDSSNSSNPNQYYAVTVSSVGTIQVWRYDSGAGTWVQR